MDLTSETPATMRRALHPRARARPGRRAFVRALVAVGVGALLTGDRRLLTGRPLPIAVDGDSARYLQGLPDIPTPDWALLAVTAAIGDPGGNAARGLFGRLPLGSVRGAALDWTYRAEAGRTRDLLAQAERVYAAFLPPGRARYYGGLLAAERARLAAGGQVDYSGLAHLVTQVNREQGLIARAEIADLQLVRQHRIDPANQPKDAATLLRERQERRSLTLAFRREAARLLGTATRRAIAAPTGTLTLLGDLGATPGDRAATHQFVRASLGSLDDAAIAAEAVYFTAGEFLALEPATPPDRWADRLPADQRAYAATNTLSPRLSRAALLDPAHASRILWLSVQECRALVAELRAL